MHREKNCRAISSRSGYLYPASQSAPLSVGTGGQWKNHDVPFDFVREGQENREDNLPDRWLYSSGNTGQESKGTVEFGVSPTNHEDLYLSCFELAQATGQNAG